MPEAAGVAFHGTIRRGRTDVLKDKAAVVLRWFNYNHSVEEGLNYNTAEDCLLHIGNLD